jgi:competence protein ComEC
MATVMLGAVLAGRPGSALPGVVLAAAVLVVARPLLIDDVSFQLSFASTLGIILASQRLRLLIQPRISLLPGWLAAFLAENLAITTAASLAVLPVIAGTFGRVSIVALPANLLAAPAFVLALFGSAITAAAGDVDPALGRIAGELAYLPLTYLVRLARLASDVPGASLEVTGFGALETATVYVLLAAVYLCLRRGPAREPEAESTPHFHLRPTLAVSGVLAVAAVVVWWGAIQPDSGRLQVTVLDVGQGDAILVTTPAGHRILIDGGPSGVALSQALGRELPAGVHRIDLIVLSHAQDDHLVGLVGVLGRYEVGAVLLSPLEGETAANRAWQETLAEHAVPVREAVAGEWLDLGEGAWLEVLGPAADLPAAAAADLNNASVVLRLVHGSVSFLLTGDLTAEGEDALLGRGAALASTVLKVGHHGSDGSTTAAFLAAVRPAVAVISVGAENPYGHPSPSTELRLGGVPYFRTDRNGRIRFETDGERLWAEVDEGEARLVQRR